MYHTKYGLHESILPSRKSKEFLSWSAAEAATATRSLAAERRSTTFPPPRRPVVRAAALLPHLSVSDACPNAANLTKWLNSWIKNSL